MRLKALNKVCDKWSDFSDDYFIGDDGFIYRRLKTGYYRGKDYCYQQTRSRFGTDERHTIKLHRAVAMAFIDRPEGATEVDHINNNKTDNRASNLQWLTHRANSQKRETDRKGSEDLSVSEF